MTLVYGLDLDILPLDLHAKIQDCMSICLVGRVRRTHRQTDNARTIIQSADVGCNDTSIDQNITRNSLESVGSTATNVLNCSIVGIHQRADVLNGNKFLP